MSSYPFYRPTATESTQERPGSEATESDPGQQYLEPHLHPSVDLFDKPDAVEVFIDLPGFTEDNINLRCEGSTLLVTAERFEDAADDQGVLLHERPSKAERAIQIPVQVDLDESNAKYEDGVAKITLPKKEAGQAREIRFS